MNQMSSPKISRQHQPPGLRAIKPQGVAHPELLCHATNVRQSNPDIAIPQLPVLTPPLSPPTLTLSDFPYEDFAALLGTPGPSPAPNFQPFPPPASWNQNFPASFAYEDPSQVPSGAIPSRRVLPPPTSELEWIQRPPGIHAWMKIWLDCEGEVPPTSPWTVLCHICSDSVPQPAAHLQEHARQWARAIILDELMTFRDLVLSVQFVIAKDRANHEVFTHDENCAFATFLWNYDSLENLSYEAVRFSDSIDEGCLRAYRFRVLAWAVGECLNSDHPEDLVHLGIDPEIFAEALNGVIPLSLPTFTP